MRICGGGADHSGGPTVAGMTQRAPNREVAVVDPGAARIGAGNSEGCSIREPGLCRPVQDSRGMRRVVLTAVPSGILAAVDLPPVEAGARAIGAVTTALRITFDHATVPGRPAEVIQRILASTCPPARCQVRLNSESSAEGAGRGGWKRPALPRSSGHPREVDQGVAADSILAGWTRGPSVAFVRRLRPKGITF